MFRRLFALMVLVLVGLSGPAGAHGLSSVVYADATDGADAQHVRVEVGLEFDLMLLSVSDLEEVPGLFYAGDPVWQARDTAAMAAVVKTYRGPIDAYVADRLVVERGGAGCTARPLDEVTIQERQEVPYAFLAYDYACDEATITEVRITSSLFPDVEGRVRDTTTVLTYDLDGTRGSAALTSQHPTASTLDSWADRAGEFFRLGAEHLYLGLDHVLFLLALIIGSRRLREIVWVATAFTVAHSITFVAAALGLVSVPGDIVEPIIAASIAAVAVWHLVRLRHRDQDSSDLGRLATVFGFGLIHGLGFAGALGIDEPLSWTLLGSLLIFNLGIEAVQIGFIVVLFPLLTLLRRSSPRVATLLTASVALFVAVVGTYWFLTRIGIPL